MNSVEKRVASLEGRSLEQSMRIDDVRDALASLETRMDRRFEQLEQRFGQLEHRLDQRFAAVDLRFVGMDKRLDSIDYKFGWFIGIGIAVLLGVLGQWFRP